mgnify:CR=1 FL=1
MNNQEACELLERLIAGVHPTTGELLANDSAYSDPMVLRALALAIQALRNAQEPARRTRESRANNRLSWTGEEDEFLRRAFSQGLTPSAIGAQLQRSEHNVKVRLNALGLASREALGLRGAGSQGSRQIWTGEEDEFLRKAFSEGLTPPAIAAQLHRTANNVKLRLYAMGLASREALGLNTPAGQGNRGTPWFPEQEAQVAELFKAGTAPAEIARQMGRSELSILYRLEKLGLIADRNEYMNDADAAHKGSAPAPSSPGASFPADAPFPTDADAPPEFSDDLPF